MSPTREYGGLTEPILVPGALHGYRTWSLSGPGLRGVFVPETWQPGVNTASCHKGAIRAAKGGMRGGVWVVPTGASTGTHRSPDSQCTCGFYARYVPSLRELGPWTFSGVIEASGRVLLGTEGFRAEKARVVALFIGQGVWDNIADKLKRCAEFYDAELFDFSSQMLEKYPPQDVSELLPSQELPPEQEFTISFAPDNWMAQ